MSGKTIERTAVPLSHPVRVSNAELRDHFPWELIGYCTKVSEVPYIRIMIIALWGCWHHCVSHRIVRLCFTAELAMVLSRSGNEAKVTAEANTHINWDNVPVLQRETSSHSADAQTQAHMCAVCIQYWKCCKKIMAIGTEEQWSCPLHFGAEVLQFTPNAKEIVLLWQPLFVAASSQQEWWTLIVATLHCSKTTSSTLLLYYYIVIRGTNPLIQTATVTAI